MSFAIIENNTFVRWRSPSDYPNTSFPQGVDHPSFNLFWVHAVAPVNPDPAVYRTEPADPVYSAENSRWETGYTYPEMTQQEKNHYKDTNADRSGFRNALLADSLFLAWEVDIKTNGDPTDDVMHDRLLAASVAADTDIPTWVSNIQSIYDLLKADVLPPVGAIDAWQNIADSHSIRFVA